MEPGACRDALLQAALAAYGVGYEHIAPLLAWFAP
jgi:hypothetical protein